LTTLFYILVLWLLFNVVFALGMYFRPTRKAEVGSPNNLAPQVRREPFVGGSAPPNVEAIPVENRQPAWFSRILFFGMWLSARRPSV
jgi:hypothetical protein